MVQVCCNCGATNAGPLCSKRSELSVILDAALSYQRSVRDFRYGCEVWLRMSIVVSEEIVGHPAFCTPLDVPGLETSESSRADIGLPAMHTPQEVWPKKPLGGYAVGCRPTRPLTRRVGQRVGTC